jgi:type VI secretion system secreted protein Hcp
MGKTFLMTMTLSKQGKIRGSSIKTEGGLDYSKGLECHAFNYDVTAQFNSSSGQPTGKRQHQPVKITREVDSASPLLWSALCSNESFTTATLSFARPTTKGNSFKPPKIELRNGFITGIRPAGTNKGKKLVDLTLDYEEVWVNDSPSFTIPRSILG